MGARRKAREYALQVLFQIDLSKVPSEKALELFWSQNNASQTVKEFTDQLVLGVANNIDELNGKISEHSTNWKLSRMAVVDRNVLRMAVFELFHCPDVPKKVTLNEAIEIAKTYGSEDSGAFVNGVIDKIARKVDK